MATPDPSDLPYPNTGGPGLTPLPPSPPHHPLGQSIGKNGAKKRGRPSGSKGKGGAFHPDGNAPVANNSPVATPAERADARNLLQSIGQRFAENRQRSKSKAFETYQRDLAQNMSTLIMGQAVTMKELTVLLMDLEGFMKSTSKEGETPAVLLAKFLRGELTNDD